MKSIPQWFVRYSQHRSYSRTQEEPYDLLFFLSKFYQATLYYTLNGELKPSSYLAAFADVVILFRFTNYPSDGFVVSVDIANCSVTYLLQVIDGMLIEDDSFQCVESNCIVDLSFRGERWEGQTLDGRPFGWGKYFDSDNRLLYHGFMFGSARICYGSSYYRNLSKEVIRYQGNYGWNEALGYGTRFDRQGNAVYEGEWISNHPLLSRSVCLESGSSFLEDPSPLFAEGGDSCIEDSIWDLEDRIESSLDDIASLNDIASLDPSSQSTQSTHSTQSSHSNKSLIPPPLTLLLTSLTEELSIGDRCCNDARLPTLDLSFLTSLRSVAIGQESFRLTHSFTLRGLPRLLSLSVAQHSFLDDSSALSGPSFRVADFRVADCPRLQLIDIGPGCFSAFQRCELRNLPALRSLRIGGGDAWAFCFKYCRELHLAHFPRLERVAIGGHSFPRVRSIRFENLPAVEEIECERCSLQGDLACDVSENRLVMKDLPRLGDLSLGTDCMSHIGCVVIDNVPNTERVCIGQDSLYYTQFVYARKAERLQSKIASRRSIVQRSLLCE